MPDFNVVAERHYPDRNDDMHFARYLADLLFWCRDGNGFGESIIREAAERQGHPIERRYLRPMFGIINHPAFGELRDHEVQKIDTPGSLAAVRRFNAMLDEFYGGPGLSAAEQATRSVRDVLEASGWVEDPTSLTYMLASAESIFVRECDDGMGIDGVMSDCFYTFDELDGMFGEDVAPRIFDSLNVARDEEIDGSRVLCWIGENIPTQYSSEEE